MQNIQQRVFMPRAYMVLFSVLAALFMITSAAFAWIVLSDAKTNEIDIMQYQFSVEIQDDTEIEIYNSGDIPQFVRVMVFPTLVAADGMTLLEAQIGKQVQINALGASWIDGQDGFYYYTGKIAPDSKAVDSLFDNITVGGGIDANARLTITVMVEAIDATGSYYRMAWWKQDNAPAHAQWMAIDNALQNLI